MSTSTASRPLGGRITGHEPSDYPIVLGDSFGPESSSSKFLRLRYNWEPRNGFSGQRGTLKRVNGKLQLAYREDGADESTYDYDAHLSDNINDDGDQKTSQLALVFDPARSAYVLEHISQSFQLNLTSAHDQTRDEVRQLKQIKVSSGNSQQNPLNRIDSSADSADKDADPSNPFDFRHFLSEAKENAEKAAQPNGGRTPVPGSRTPMSGIASPSLAAGRFNPTTTTTTTTTPQFRPTPTSGPASKKAVAAKSAPSTAPKKQSTAKRKVAAPKTATPKPLSNEVVSDSSDDDDTRNTNSMSKTSVSQNNTHSHKRNTSSSDKSKSPHVVYDTGGLEIDMGSPPPETRRRAVLDLEAFRSQSHTPALGVSSNKPAATLPQQDVEMQNRSEDGDEDDEEDQVQQPSPHEQSDMDIDGDVEEMALDSPASRKEDENREEEETVKAPAAPTPLPLPAEEDEADDFAAELEDLLGQDDEEESEVSEEE